MMLNRLRVSMIVTLAAVNGALAQATPPAAPAADGSGLSWVWIIIGLAIIAGLVWYFMRGRSRATTTGTSTSSGTATNHPKVFDNDKRR